MAEIVETERPERTDVRERNGTTGGGKRNGWRNL